MAGVQRLGRVYLSCLDFFDIHGCYAANKSRGLLGEVTALEIPCENASLGRMRCPPLPLFCSLLSSHALMSRSVTLRGLAVLREIADR